MSGEQPVPTDAELIATAVKDARDAEELLDGLETIEYGPEQDYLSHLAEHVVALAIRLEDAAEVRALPDRRMIAREFDPAAWNPDSRFSVAERAIRQETSLGKADAVLALFGQEGQR